MVAEDRPLKKPTLLAIGTWIMIKGKEFRISVLQ